MNHETGEDSGRILDELSDDALVTRIQEASDHDAFNKLTERYWHYLLGYLLHHGEEYHTAEEMTQEAFLRAWIHRNDIHNGTFFKSWLVTIGINVERSEHRHAAHTPSSHSEAIDEGDLIAIDSMPTPPESLNLKEMHMLVHRAIDNLSDDFSRPIIAHYLEDILEEDIAMEMGIPLGTVKSRIHTAKRRLHEALEEVVLN